MYYDLLVRVSLAWHIEYVLELEPGAVHIDEKLYHHPYHHKTKVKGLVWTPKIVLEVVNPRKYSHKMLLSFVPKKDGSLWVLIMNCGLNKDTLLLMIFWTIFTIMPNILNTGKCPKWNNWRANQQHSERELPEGNWVLFVFDHVKLQFKRGIIENLTPNLGSVLLLKNTGKVTYILELSINEWLLDLFLVSCIKEECALPVTGCKLI